MRAQVSLLFGAQWLYVYKLGKLLSAIKNRFLQRKAKTHSYSTTLISSSGRRGGIRTPDPLLVRETRFHCATRLCAYLDINLSQREFDESTMDGNMEY